MEYIIYNRGGTKTIPYKQDSILLAKNIVLTTDDVELAKLVSLIPMVQVTPEPDSETLSRSELMRKAKAAGVDVSRNDTKESLLDKLRLTVTSSETMAGTEVKENA